MAKATRTGWQGNRWRLAAWGTAAGLLLLPLVAMGFTEEVNWTLSDFLFAGILVGGVGLAYELVARSTRRVAFRAGAAVGLAAAFLLVWLNGAVGLIGSEDNPANRMYFGVLATAIVGAVIARLRPEGMARAMAATAAAQLLVGLVATVGRLGLPGSGPLELIGLSGGFAALWLLSAWLFRRAARG